MGDLGGKFIQSTAGHKSRLITLGEGKTIFQYVAEKRGATFVLVNEAFTTVTCFSCGEKTGPKGKKGLSIRDWACPNCHAIHDRDINAAQNILNVGQKSILLPLAV